MTVTVKHSKTNAITDWTQAQLDEQIELGNFPSGTTLANIVLPSDWNNDHTLTGVGTMAEQDATAVAITGGTINNTTIGATTASTGVFTTLTVNNTTGTSLANIWSNTNTSPIADLQFTRGTTSTWGGDAFTDYKLRASGGNFIVQSQNNATAVLDLLTFDEANNAVKFSPGGIEQARVSRTASAVNYVQVTGGATGTYPAILGTGSDGTVGLQLAGKGGTIDFRNNGIGTATQFSVAFTASSVNYLNATGSGVSGNAPRLFALGTDTNISMAFQPKGTGAINLAAGSSGVNISNGGTVTAVTITNNGANYTSFPTPAISAPTTAGGVQATISLLRMFQNGATVANGGTGYAVGNVLTVVGGTNPGTAATLTVTTVSGGVITGVSSTNFAQYTALPTNPVSVTGGAGSGATLNLTWSVPNSVLGTSYSITNAGSGYIEQPTITFSGGGGSGAAAYATVGSGTIVRSLGSTMSFNTPSGESFRVQDNGTLVASYMASVGTSGVPYILAGGSATNISTAFSSKGTGNVSIWTNGGNQEQLRVAHTASAVNYVQVTGNVTTSPPIISAQGSDSTVAMLYRTKGNGVNHSFQNGSGNNGLVVTPVNSTANYLQVSSSIATAAPSIASAGTDTNIDLALTPKGTGLVAFGTYTAGAPTATGYISIKSAAGVTYKVLVST